MSAARPSERADQRLASIFRRTMWGQLGLVALWSLISTVLGREKLLVVAAILAGVAAVTGLIALIERRVSLRAAAALLIALLWGVLAARIVDIGNLNAATYFVMGVLVVEAGLFIGTRGALAVVAASAVFGAVVASLGGPATPRDPVATWTVGVLMFAILLALQWATERLFLATIASERDAMRREREMFESAPFALIVYDVVGAHDWLVERGLLGKPEEVRRLAAEAPEQLADGLVKILTREANPAALRAGARPATPRPVPPRPENRHGGVHVLEALAAGGGVYQREMQVVLDAGTRTMIASFVMPSARQQLDHVLIAYIDVTAERALEEKVKDAQRLETVRLLAGGIAHDFNNLLTVLRMGVDRVGKVLPEAGASRRDVDRMRDAVTRASARTRQLLLFGRRELARPIVIAANRALTDLEPLLRRTLDRGIALTLELAEDAGSVEIDPSLVEQVILNLVFNAQEAMPDGGRLTLRSARRRDGDHDLVVIEVVDDGRGMSDEERRRAFEPFFTTKPSARGAGLGLSIVHGIVTQAGGTVTIASAPGRGTTVTVALPSVAGVVDEPAVAAAPARAVAGERVLLVEDEDGVREVAQASLEEAGYEVVAVRSGDEALAAIDAGQAIDLVVSDLVMPGIGGHELAGRLRRSRPDLPIVFVSGFAPEGDPTASLAGRGATTFLAKPFSGDQLLASVRSVLTPAAAS